jgi:thiol-disulfide isomerase/thioredoxin
MKQFAIAVCLLALIIIGPLVNAQDKKGTHKQTTKLLAVGEIAPNWELTDVEGKHHSLSQYLGKVVVMDFWATWCGPCKEVMPRIQKLYDKYQDKQVVVFGVNSWEKDDPVALMKKRHFSYGLLLKGEEIAEEYRVSVLPAVYIIGSDGKVIYSHEGVDDKNLGSLIDNYLKNVSATTVSTTR